MARTTFDVPEMAEALSLSEGTVRIYAVRYKVGWKEKGDWKFTASDLKILRNRNKKVGKPRKEK